MTRRPVVLAAASATLLVFGFHGTGNTGGPQLWKAPGVPFVWPAGGRNIPFLTDQGSLGPMTNADAVAQTSAAFGQWDDLPTATVGFQHLGSLGFDVDATNFGEIYFGEPDGTVRVIYDADGTISDELGGGFLGVTLIRADGETGEIAGSVVILNGAGISGYVTPDEYAGIVVHEIGHAVGLAHSVVNGALFVEGDHTGPTPHDTFSRPASHAGKIETMFPIFLAPGDGGEETPHADDIAAISSLYPEPEFLSGTGAISGRVLTVRGEPLRLPVTVIARNVDDPFDDALSARVGGGVERFSGHDPSLDGRYTLRGLRPGARYAVYVDDHTQETDRFPLGGPEEFYNGAEESNDPAVDDPSVFTPVVAVAGAMIEGIDIRLNKLLPGRLSIADFERVELFPPFPVRMCGQTFDSVHLAADGYMELALGSSPFGTWHFDYRTDREFRGARSVIAGLSASLAPWLGGEISFEQTSETFTVHFLNVPEDVPETGGGPGSTFSMTLHAAEGEEASRLTLTYGQLAAARHVFSTAVGAGYSCGARFTSGAETATDLSRRARREIDGTGRTAMFEVFPDGVVDLAGKTLTFRLPGPFQDEFEPNGSLDEARRVGLPFDTVDEFTWVRPGDVDFYRFNAVAGETVVAERFPPNELAVVRASPPLDILPRLRLGLFEGGPGGALLATSDDATYPVARLIFTVPADGEYVLAVSMAPDIDFTGAGQDYGRYRLALNAYRGRPLPLGFGQTVEVPLAFPFPYQAAEWSSVWVNTNGNLTFGEGDPRNCRLDRFLGGPPRIAPFCSVLNPPGFRPGVTGLVLADEQPDSLTIHWVSVPLWFNETVSFSVTLDRRGHVTMRWGDMPAPRFSGPLIVGITQGRGAIAQPTDLSRKRNQSVKGTIYEQFPPECMFPTCVTPFDLAFRELRFSRRGTVVLAPQEVIGSGSSGSLSYDVVFGYSGPFSATSSGLFAATETVATVPDDPHDDVEIALFETGIGVTTHTVVIPTGTSHARIALFDEETDGQHDLDLHVLGPEGFFVAISGGLTANEVVGLDSPEPGTYTVVVHGFETEGPTATYTLFTWLLDAGHARKMSVVAPRVAHEGETGQVDASWKRLAPDRRYLGAILYCPGSCRAPDDVMGRTFVRVHSP